MKEKGHIGKLVGWLCQSWRSMAGLVALISVIVVVGIILWVLPIWLTASGLSDDVDKQVLLQNENRRTLAQISLGLVVLGTLYFTRRQMIATERRVAAAERTVEITQEGQITERFTRAVEQLGNGKKEIRLGGIYALERIAKDSSKDHWQVMEVLTAFVRENKWWKDQPYEGRESSYYQDLQFFKRIPMPTDIQAILNVLRNRNYKYEEPRQRLDLSGASLLGATFKDTHLKGAIFRDADLRHSDFHNVNLQYADLSSVMPEEEITGVRSGTNLQDAVLGCADLRFADFEAARLGGANLKGADLRGAVNLTREQIASAITDENTKLPDYLKASQRQ